MARAGGHIATDSDLLRYAEYKSTSNQRSETDIDKRIGSTLIAVGLGVAAAGIAGIQTCSAFSLGSVSTFVLDYVFLNEIKIFQQFISRYAFHLWKPLGQVITETAKKFPSTAFSAYYKGGFEQKMTKREASLVLGISPTSTKTKVREAHRRIMVLNHPDKGGSPYLAAKINEAKDLLESGHRS
ncbi:hypothetical protein QTP70_027200 [Hemibagrus guttatus]|uniref:J domain-containing protein n=1 Tax=Hemibagrus guttatus TaxID=175788 RepID=A0AAE0R571_9TELE|nr:hypothetical protein QTP70_027200 [Hemibagrus guttatus]KAK3569253.1 hypothetical protein QTP86_026596 [Hemibagrus guttatus]